MYADFISEVSNIKCKCTCMPLFLANLLWCEWDRGGQLGGCVGHGPVTGYVGYVAMRPV